MDAFVHESVREKARERAILAFFMHFAFVFKISFTHGCCKQGGWGEIDGKKRYKKKKNGGKKILDSQHKRSVEREMRSKLLPARSWKI